MSGAVSDDIREEFKESAVNVGITFVELERDEPLSHVSFTRRLSVVLFLFLCT